MSKYPGRTRRAACMLSLLLLGIWSQSILAADKWHIQDAPIRFRVSLSQRPSHSNAGYFLHLPDGGILPGPNPLARVVNAAGNPVKSYTLWQNPSTGLAIVFADPGPGGSILVYVLRGHKPEFWKPSSGLTPSAILCADAGKNSLASARQLGQMGRVGTRVSFSFNEANSQAPLCVKGDLSGRPRPGSLYLLSYVNTSDPGKTWISPFTGKDNVEIRIDGQPINSQKRIDKWGGTGAWVDLKQGLHRVEVFAACGGSGGYGGQGVAWLAWATPNASSTELGGLRPDGAPFAGTPKWASRPINASEIVSSGKCSIQDIRMKNAGPVAGFRPRAIENYWVGNSAPVYTYAFKALKTGNPEGTRYTWDFGNGARAEGERVRWLLSGQQDHMVRLIASHGNQKSVASVPVYAFATVSTSLNNPSARENIRKAFLDVIRAHPKTANVSANWSPGMWQCFLDIQELGKGQLLLEEVLINRRSTLSKHVPQDSLSYLQDIFFHWISHHDPDKAIKWLKSSIQKARPFVNKYALNIRLAEVNMYHKQNFNEARRILKGMSIGTKPHAILAAIRLGDVAFLEGNLNDANRYWGKVENKSNVADAIAAEGKGVRWAGEAARSAEMDKDRSRMLRATRRAGGGKNQDWRKAAVLDSNISISINSLLKQGYYEAALIELALWERFFPLSKLSEDFILLEARCYMSMDNITRARSLLEAYCRNIEASSFLPDAAELLEQCMKNQRAPASELNAFYKKMSKRLEYHPTGQRMKEKLGYQ